VRGPGEPVAVLTRLEPWLDSLHTTPDPTTGAADRPATGAAGARAPTAGHPAAAGSAAPGWCPLCAVRTALRGDRAEVGRRLAERGADALVTLRALLEYHPAHDPTRDATETPADPATATGVPAAPPAPHPAECGPGPGPRVQPISVRGAR